VSARVSFRVTTYYKRPRGEPGLTQAASQRLDISEAIAWVLAELPEEAVAMTFEGDDGTGAARKTIIAIDWDHVPAQVKDGLA